MNPTTSQNIKRPRVVWIDTAKGICILLVVLQHASIYLGVDYPFKRDFLTFRMPLYFILSGLFFKTYEGFAGFAKRKINKLIIPYVFFFIVGSVIIPYLLYQAFGIKIWFYSNYGLEGVKYLFTEKAMCNPAIWFLACLFEVNIIFYVIQIIASRFQKKELVIVLISMITGITGILLYVCHINLPYTIDSALTATPFFFFGWYLRNYTSFLSWENSLKTFIIATVFVLFFFLVVHNFNHGALYIKSNSYGGLLGMLELYPYGIIGTLMVLSISRIIGKVPVLSYLGRYSIIVLCVHCFIIQFVSDLLYVKMGESFVITFIIIAFLCVIVIPFFKNYLPWFTAQKDIVKV